jgi:hypothetical protein
MGGKGGGNIDTSGITGAAQGMQGFANQANQLAQQNYATGTNLLGYETPLLDLYKKLLLNPSQYTDPNFNVMMGLPLQQGQEAATAAKKNLLNQNLGPGMQATGMQQIDLTRMSNAQTGALQNLQQMFTALMGAGQQGTSLMSQAPGQVTQAGQLFGQSGNLYADVAKLQYATGLQNNQGFQNAINDISSIGGLLGSGFGATKGIGQIFGKGGGAGGGAAGGGTAGLSAYNPATSAYGDFGLGALPFTF